MPDPMMQFFSFSHLPEHLQKISKPFHDMAQQIVDLMPANAERAVGLRKLLESKDCIVRCSIYQKTANQQAEKPESETWR